MNLSIGLLLLGLAIGALNLHSARPHARHEHDQHASIIWPTEFEGQTLTPLPLSEMESTFAASFPGAIAHFQIGRDQLILRHIDRATRKLHSSATCLRAAGFHLDSRRIETHGGSAWVAYNARRDGTVLRVREQVRSVHAPDQNWTDVSQWFWQATLHPDQGPWIAVTVLQPSTPYPGRGIDSP